MFCDCISSEGVESPAITNTKSTFLNDPVLDSARTSCASSLEELPNDTILLQPRSHIPDKDEDARLYHAPLRAVRMQANVEPKMYHYLLTPRETAQTPYYANDRSKSHSAIQDWQNAVPMLCEDHFLVPGPGRSASVPGNTGFDMLQGYHVTNPPLKHEKQGELKPSPLTPTFVSRKGHVTLHERRLVSVEGSGEPLAAARVATAIVLSGVITILAYTLDELLGFVGPFSWYVCNIAADLTLTNFCV